MESPSQSSNRYSDAELSEFKAVIEKKLAAAYEDLEYLKEQINNTTESMENDGDYMDDSNSFSDMELFHSMAHRTQKYVQGLENALYRISNKTYGVCTVTGELIDKRRLLAVPTTSMSIHAKKTDSPAPARQDMEPRTYSNSSADTKTSGASAAARNVKKKPADDFDFSVDEE